MGSRRLLAAVISGWPGEPLVGTKLWVNITRGHGACLGLECGAVRYKESTSVIIRPRRQRARGGCGGEGRVGSDSETGLGWGQAGMPERAG